jgi:hypothetical protein
MSNGKGILFICWCAVLGLLLRPSPARAQIEWQPIDPADLAMKEEPLAPGAPAIYLYREVKGDDLQGFADYYFRIKILTEAGKDKASVHIEYLEEYKEFGEYVADIQGRTIHADGTVIPWQGKALDQFLEREHGVKYLAKTFALPDVQVGSIVEYKYRIAWDRQYLIPTYWDVSEPLFTRQLHCTLKRNNTSDEPYDLMWQTERLPPGSSVPKEGAADVFHFDAQNIPGIEEEPFMPPLSSIEGQVIFYYADRSITDPNKFWKKVGKERYSAIEKFVGHYKSIQDEVARVIQPGDSPETKLRKLYARAQQIRYLSFEPEKTADEEKKENLKENKDVEDVLKNDYAKGDDINWFFVALARSAGFQASAVMVSTRSKYFFDPRIVDQRQMNDFVVAVGFNGQDILLDPATKHCPFGLLPWSETGVQGIKLDKDGGNFVTTPLPKSSDALIERDATFAFGDGGWLNGKFVVSFSGQEALTRRVDNENEDDATRNKKLTDEVISWFPAGAILKLTNSPDWAGSEAPLRFEFDVKTHYAGTSTGRRVIMSETLLADSWIPRFDHPDRKYPVYFDYPWTVKDDVTVTLALQLKLEGSSAPVNVTAPFAGYHLSCEKQPAALHFVREMNQDGIYYPLEHYSDIRSFFQMVRTSDAQQIILENQ